MDFLFHVFNVASRNGCEDQYSPSNTRIRKFPICSLSYLSFIGFNQVGLTELACFPMGCAYWKVSVFPDNRFPKFCCWRWILLYVSRKPGWDLVSDSYLSDFMWVWLPERLNAAGLGLQRGGEENMRCLSGCL